MTLLLNNIKPNFNYFTQIIRKAGEKMRNTYTLIWQTEPENYKTYQRKGFNTKSEAKVYAQKNGIQDYEIVYQN